MRYTRELRVCGSQIIQFVTEWYASEPVSTVVISDSDHARKAEELPEYAEGRDE